MDIEAFFKKNFKTSYQSVYQSFYLTFLKERVDEMTKKYATFERFSDKNFLAEVRKKLPDAEMIMDESGRKIKTLQLKNTFFEGAYWRNGFRLATGGLSFSRNRANLLGMMCEIDEQIPKWNEEFLNLTNQYRQRLTERELKRRETVNDFYDFYSDWLLTKPNKIECEKIIFEKMQTEWQHLVTVEKQGDDKIVQTMSLQNLRLMAFKWAQSDGEHYRSRLELGGMDARTAPTHAITLEELRELDALVPQWKKTYEEIEFENAKRTKAKGIAQKSVTALVESKMKELGCEYKMDNEDETITLAVKLQKKRQIKVSLPYGNIELVQKRLAELQTCIEAINRIPITMRISTYGEF